MTRWLLSLTCLAVCACAGSDERSFTLDNGVEVLLSGPGLELSIDGRPLASLAKARGPAARTFDETVEGPFAIWTFTRTDERAIPFARKSAELADGAVRIEYSASGGRRLEVVVSSDGPERTRMAATLLEGDADSLELSFRCDEDGSFHGFGEQYNATDQRGETFDLFVGEQGIGRGGALRAVTGDAHTTYFPMPYFLDARGFGVLFETDRRVVVDLCASDERVATFDVGGAAPFDVVVFHGPTPADVVEQLGDVVGRPAKPPSWAFGEWISIQGGQDEVLARVDELEEAAIPFTAVWTQDWTGLRLNLDGGFGVQYRWAADETLYPDLEGLVAELHARGVRFLAYANPFVAQELDDFFPEMDAMSLLLKAPEGAAGCREITPNGTCVFFAPNGQSAHPDLTDPAAYAFVKDALVAMVEDYGFDGWMADFGEWTPLDVIPADGTDGISVHNRYPVEWQRVNREAMEEARPDGDWVVFGRSGFTGVQGASQIHWVGDQEVDFSTTDGLPTVVPALLNLGLSGIPFTTHDIGGFSGRPRGKEVFLRWTELGAFTAIFRTHEGNARDENWQWYSDDETKAHFRCFAELHELLRPEIEALAEVGAATSMPIVRHMMLVFPQDPETHPLSDQFMLGDTLLVAPVVEEGATTRELYLPDGTWYDVFTGESLAGGRRAVVDAPLGRPPVFSLGVDRPDLRDAWTLHCPAAITLP
jgi:sulfoquinovosidase